MESISPARQQLYWQKLLEILTRGAQQPTQYSCLENPMDRGAWWAAVHGVAKSWTLLKQLTHHTHSI